MSSWHIGSRDHSEHRHASMSDDSGAERTPCQRHKDRSCSWSRPRCRTLPRKQWEFAGDRLQWPTALPPAEVRAEDRSRALVRIRKSAKQPPRFHPSALRKLRENVRPKLRKCTNARRHKQGRGNTDTATCKRNIRNSAIPGRAWQRCNEPALTQDTRSPVPSAADLLEGFLASPPRQGQARSAGQAAYKRTLGCKEPLSTSSVRTHRSLYCRLSGSLCRRACSRGLGTVRAVSGTTFRSTATENKVEALGLSRHSTRAVIFICTSVHQP